MGNTVAFTGFRPGSRVTIDDVTAASWGDETGADGTSIWDEPQSPGTTVTINVIRSAHRVAPEGVFFNLTLSGFDTNTLSFGQYDPSYHDKYVFWDYGEADAYTFAAPTQVLAMDAADGSQRTHARYSRGPLGSHVFRTPDRHTIRVAVLEPSSGKIGFGIVDVNVGNPDTFYAGAATLFVDTTQTYTNAPSGARRFSNIDAALAAMNAATTPHRVVLERGQVHTMSSNYGYRPPSISSGCSLRLEAQPGGGAKPIVVAGAGITGGNLIYDNSLRDIPALVDSGVVIRGIDFRGPWDTRTGTGRLIDCIEFNGIYSCKHVLIDECDFSGWAETLYPNRTGGRTPDRTIFLNDVAIRGWAGVGFFGASDDVLSFTGCGFVQDPDAITRQKDGNGVLGPIRIVSSRMCNFWACDLFSATGWSPYNGINAVQPGLRWNTTPYVDGAMLNLQASAIESGRLAMSLKPQNTATQRRVANGLVEGIIAISGFQGNAVAHSAFGGMTHRNNFYIFAGNKNSNSIGGLNQSISGFVYLYGGAQGDPSNESSPVRVYNNTMVNLSNVNAVETGDRIGMSDVITHNNILHQPGFGQPYPGLLAVQAFSARYRGYRLNATTLHAAYVTPPDSASLWIPQVSLSSPALGNALTEPSSSLDFQGEKRPEPPSLGALEAE